ncbi:MAG: hypothetical protein HFJ89_09670 [Oscillospiraceae bacterium]|jgi:hypothetical protein|nr:hypothetical protein [Oscillospiraceae bacterium]
MTKSEIDPKRFLSKKRLKQALMLVVILLISLSLSGCENFVETDVSAETKSTKQTISETTAPDNQDETIFVTDFEITDWTMEDLISDIKIYGKQISLPCNVSDLGKDYSLSDVYCYIQSSNQTGSELYYKNKYVAAVYFYGNNEDLINKNIVKLYLGGFNRELPDFEIMGITSNSTLEDVKKILGDSNIINAHENQLRYMFEDQNQLFINFDSNGKMNAFFITNNIKEK